MAPKYAIVKFPDEDNVRSIVCLSWVDEVRGLCSYPNVKTEGMKEKMLREEHGPERDWPVFPIVILHKYDTYNNARLNLRKSEDTSNLSSDDEQPQKRRRIRRILRLPGETDSEDEPVSPMIYTAKHKTAKHTTLPYPVLKRNTSTVSTSPEYQHPTTSTQNQHPSTSTQNQHPSTSTQNQHHSTSTQKQHPFSAAALSDADRMLLVRINTSINDLFDIVQTLKNKVDQLVQQGQTNLEADEGQNFENLFLLLPVKSMEDLEEINRHLENNKHFTKTFVKNLTSVGGDKVTIVISNMMKRIIHDDLACQISFSGKSFGELKKTSFSSTEMCKKVFFLRIVENANLKFPKFSEDYKDYLRSQTHKNKDLWAFSAKSVEVLTPEIYEDRRKDHISHFILRLAYCRSDELRKWFIKHEVDLFQLRFQEEAHATQGVLKQNGLFYEPIDESERKDLLPDLQSVLPVYTKNNKPIPVSSMMFFKVPFQEILDLVAVRKVYIKGGFAYVCQNDLGAVVANVYRMQLSQALAVMARLLPQMEEDDRLLSILKGINDRYLGQDYGKTAKSGSGEVVPEMIDSLSKTSFPLCMRTVHEAMCEKHHLKHHGRLVYGLFLKAIGLSLDGAQRFFREAFLKGMDSETYEKKGYTYNIRYNYGEEGKKTNYTPYNCVSIITKHAPGPGDAHGCPFKHFDKNILTQRLQAMNISKQGIQEIIELCSKGHYQVACTKQFELTHGGRSTPQAITHPNYYYDQSRDILKKPDNANMIATDKPKPKGTHKVTILPSQTSAVNDIESSMSQEDEELLSQVNLDDF